MTVNPIYLVYALFPVLCSDQKLVLTTEKTYSPLTIEYNYRGVSNARHNAIHLRLV